MRPAKSFTTDASERVKNAVFDAALAFLNEHRFLIETKNGRDFIVFSSGVRKEVAGFWAFIPKGLDAAFLERAENAGKRCIKELGLKHLSHQDAVFDEGIGRAMVSYIAQEKGSPMEIEMQELPSSVSL